MLLLKISHTRRLQSSTLIRSSHDPAALSSSYSSFAIVRIPWGAAFVAVAPGSRRMTLQQQRTRSPSPLGTVTATLRHEHVSGESTHRGV